MLWHQWTRMWVGLASLWICFSWIVLIDILTYLLHQAGCTFRSLSNRCTHCIKDISRYLSAIVVVISNIVSYTLLSIFMLWVDWGGSCISGVGTLKSNEPNILPSCYDTIVLFIPCDLFAIITITPNRYLTGELLGNNTNQCFDISGQECG